MRRQDTAVAVDEREFRVVNLPGAGAVFQLVDGFHHMKHAARGAGVAVREQAAMGIAGQLPFKSERASGGGRPGFSLAEETYGFQFDSESYREQVVNLRDVDVGDCNAGASKRLLCGLRAAEVEHDGADEMCRAYGLGPSQGARCRRRKR